MGSGGHNVPLLRDEAGIRKLTPRETLNFQGFPKSFKTPKQMAISHLYHQAGNSVTVPLIKRIAQQIVLVL
jgi:DNA (cytosine-5)-methyltransferase 1